MYTHFIYNSKGVCMDQKDDEDEAERVIQSHRGWYYLLEFSDQHPIPLYTEQNGNEFSWKPN